MAINALERQFVNLGRKISRNHRLCLGALIIGFGAQKFGQITSHPIFGSPSDLTSRKKSLSFAMISTMMAVAVMGEINTGKLPGTSSSSLIKLLYLYPFSRQTQIIIVLCTKTIFGNGAVLARAAMAEVVGVETEKRLV